MCNVNTNELQPDIISLSRQISREGFEELIIEDIAELTIAEAPNDEETMEIIS